jgi:hypothetical protein
MSIVRRTRADIDEAKLLAELKARLRPSEEEIEAQAAEDSDAWTDDELADAEPVHPPPSAEELRALRTKLGLMQKQSDGDRRHGKAQPSRRMCGKQRREARPELWMILKDVDYRRRINEQQRFFCQVAKF